MTSRVPVPVLRSDRLPRASPSCRLSREERLGHCAPDLAGAFLVDELDALAVALCPCVGHRLIGAGDKHLPGGHGQRIEQSEHLVAIAVAGGIILNVGAVLLAEIGPGLNELFGFRDADHASPPANSSACAAARRSWFSI